VGKRKRTVGRPFKKGQSGNPRGRRPGNPFQHVAGEIVTRDVAQRVVQAITVRAAAGDGRCASLLFDLFPPASFAILSKLWCTRSRRHRRRIAAEQKGLFAAVR
jgi:hypothetical protein